MTQDAASLEARVACSDTALNTDGIDPVLYSVYEPVKGSGDLHSQTSFNTFGASINLQINEIEDEKGNKWLCLDNQALKVKRNGQEMQVLGKDLLETDEVLGYTD